MRNKYRNCLEMNKTGGNAIRLKLTDLQPALKNLQITARGKVRSSWNQDSGTETQKFRVLFYHAFHVKSTQFILTHTFLVLITVGLGHRVYRKLYTLIRGQCAETFENYCSRDTIMVVKH